MTFEIIGQDAEAHLDWLALLDAFREGHRLPKAEIGDTFLYRGKDTLLSRAAWIDGAGSLVKTANVFPGNPGKGLPMINGAVNLYDDEGGSLAALLDFHLVTKWKTAGDSLLGAAQLARKDSEVILIVGAGTVGHSLRQAYGALFPKARFRVWNRTPEKAETFAAEHPNTDRRAGSGNGGAGGRHHHQCHHDDRAASARRLAAPRPARGPDRRLSPRHA